MKTGDRVRIKLKEPQGIFDEAINGKVGILESNNLDPYVPYEFCIRIGNLLAGVNIDELELVEEGTEE